MAARSEFQPLAGHHAAQQRLSGAIIRYFSQHRHAALLALILSALEVRPLIGENATSHALFSLALVMLLLFALYTIQVDELAGERTALLAEKKRRSVVGWALASIAILERMASIFAPSFTTDLVGSICWFSFAAFITWTELRAVLRQKEVTGETICMSISVYLLIGLSWGLVYVFIYQLQPNAFYFPNPATQRSGSVSDVQTSTYVKLIYFSFATLTTMGYGDILPVTLQARYAAIAEAMMGIFYMAILVARLVAMQMNGSIAPRVDN
jgi:hypothetical protein